MLMPSRDDGSVTALRSWVCRDLISCLRGIGAVKPKREKESVCNRQDGQK